MATKRRRDFQCCVVNEKVRVHLCKKSRAGLRSRGEFFVQCDQNECQYVDENIPPCPLSLSMFQEEIREREESAQRYSEASECY